MKHFSIMLFLLIGISVKSFAQNIWVSGYYPGWDQTAMPPDSINFNSITHLIHFSFEPANNGTLQNNFGLDATHVNATVAAAHNAGKKVLICIGGASTATGFRNSTTTQYRATFISNIINKLTTYNYDGIDIDWEPVVTSDSTQFYLFINELRTEMDKINPALELTTATGDDYWNPDIRKIYLKTQAKFNQINLMTYVMSGPWPGWITWHGSALYNGGQHFPGAPDEFLPSADYWAQNFISTGIAPGKLGIGIGFHCDVWQGGTGTSTGGVTKPLQSWTNAPTENSDLYYTTTMTNYYTLQRYNYDTTAEAPYLSIDNTGSANDMFISYTNERAITAKFNYIRQQNLGGCIIWELGEDYYSKNNQPLKKAIEDELKITEIKKNPKTDFQNDETFIRIYPNPVEEKLNLRLNTGKATKLYISIYNSSGVKILSYDEKYIGKEFIRTFSFNYPAGLYLVKIQTNESQIIRKVLKK
ncbi:MAG: glycosyl hydrolase family 18 protein [Bacteroidales bacterium]|nr:glycosyl hydrolase family 18 protein [Bacteroidales bacterium]